MGSVPDPDTASQDHGVDSPYRKRYTASVDPLNFTPGPGGWLYADWGNGSAWLRFAKDEHNRLTRIRELHVLDPSQMRLRRIPLTRILSAVTMRGGGWIQSMLAGHINDDVPAGMLSAPPPGSWGHPAELVRRHQLERPARRRLDDSFYRDVASAYQSAVAFGYHPRKAIVADTGAADATVASWVMEARRRGYLPPAEPGKVSA
jgi:hypothetical protein